ATFDVLYDTNVLDFTSAANGSFWPAVDGWAMFANEASPGVIKVAMFNSTASAVASGTIADFNFDVLLSAPGGESPLDVVKVGATEGGLTWTDVDGSVLVQT